MLTMTATEEATKALTQQKLSLIRKYPFELLCVALALCVGYLFISFLGLQTEFRTYVITQGMKQTDIITNNTTVVQENTKVIQKNNELQQRRIEQTDNAQSKSNP
jgi:hypothetical protein